LLSKQLPLAVAQRERIKAIQVEVCYEIAESPNAAQSSDGSEEYGQSVACHLKMPEMKTKQ
jgi:hypothetical protein